MQFKVTCVSCGNQKQLAKPRAGQCFTCDICGGAMPVPSYHGKKDPFARLSSAPPSIFQRLAAAFGFLAGLSCFAGGGIILFSGAAQTSETARPEMNSLSGGLLVAVAAAFAILGLLYFFAGLNIRENGATSAIVVLLLGPAHCVLLAINLLTVVGLQKTAVTQSVALKNVLFYDAVTLSLLTVYLVCAIFSLATQDGLRRVRASRFYTLLCVYGYLTFGALVTFQGFTIMGHPFSGVQVPARLQDNLALASGIWLAVATFLWLVSACVARSHFLGALLGLLVAIPMAGACGWFLLKNAQPALEHRDFIAYIPLGGAILFLLITLCPIVLLIRSLAGARPKVPAAEPEAQLERFVFHT